MLAYFLQHTNQMQITLIRISKFTNMNFIQSTLLSRLMLLIVICSSSMLLHANNETDEFVSFYQGSFEAAKTKALGESKYLFVDFYANWCTPCKWMDETTFKNKEIIDLLSDDFISYKVDIDDEAGFKLKNKFEIKMLPTILIFNKEGELVDRIEETLDVKKLKSLIEFHLQNNVDVINVSPNVSPKDASYNKEQKELDNLYKEYKEKLTLESRTFNAQIGKYDNYKEAFDQVKIAKEQFLEQVIVLTEYNDGKTYYKVLLGEFETIEEADSFCLILKEKHKYDAIVY